METLTAINMFFVNNPGAEYALLTAMVLVPAGLLAVKGELFKNW